LLYIIGIPGAGKSELAGALVRGRRRRVQHLPVLHTVYEDGLVQLGRERFRFSGTDAMSMSVAPRVVEVLKTGVWDRVLGEGDRLTTRGFFDAAATAGYAVDVALVDTPPELAAERRASRGSDQNDAWLRGRATKIRNLREYVTIVLDGRKPVNELVTDLRYHRVFRGG